MRKTFIYKSGNAKDCDSPASLADLMTLPPTTPEQFRHLMNARVARRRAIEDERVYRQLTEWKWAAAPDE